MERTFLLDSPSREETPNLLKYRCPMCFQVLPSEIDLNSVHVYIAKRLQEDDFEIQREIQREIQDYLATLRHIHMLLAFTCQKVNIIF